MCTGRARTAASRGTEKRRTPDGTKNDAAWATSSMTPIIMPLAWAPQISGEALRHFF